MKELFLTIFAVFFLASTATAGPTLELVASTLEANIFAYDQALVEHVADDTCTVESGSANVIPTDGFNNRYDFTVQINCLGLDDFTATGYYFYNDFIESTSFE